MHFCTFITALFIVLLAQTTFAEDDAEDDSPVSDTHCAVSNLQNVEGIDHAIFYVITPDCRLYAWRNGFVPRNNEVGLNGTKRLVQTHKKTKTDRLGHFIDQRGLNKKCAKDNGAFVFGHREGEARPELILMTPYDKTFYALLRIPIEDYLEDVTHTNVPLITMFEETGAMVNTSLDLSTCAFYKEELQCFWLTNENELSMIRFEKYTHSKTKKIEYRPKDEEFLGKLDNRRMMHPMAALFESGTFASVYMYDTLTDGWLYRWNGGDRAAGGEKLVGLNTIPKMDGHLASIATLDRATMILTKCTAMECEYFYAQLQVQSATSHTCLFISKHHTIAGVITDVRLPEILPEPEALEAGVFFLFDLTNTPYWPVILLVVVSVLIFLCVFIWAFTCDSFGFKRRHELEKTMDTKYAKVFWPNNGDIVALTLSDIETGEAASPSQGLVTTEPSHGQAKTLHTATSSTMPLQSPPLTSRLLFTEEENRTASSLKHSSPPHHKHKIVTPSDAFTSKSSHPGFVNVRYATHQPPILNPRTAPGSRHSRMAPPIVDIASPAARKDSIYIPQENDDALNSVRVEPLVDDNKLVDAPYTPSVLQSRNKKALRTKRLKRKVRTPRGELELDRTQQSSKRPTRFSTEQTNLASNEPFKLSVRDPPKAKQSLRPVASKEISNVSREPLPYIEPKNVRFQPRSPAQRPVKMQPSLSSTQASSRKKLKSVEGTQASSSTTKKQNRNAVTPPSQYKTVASSMQNKSEYKTMATTLQQQSQYKTMKASLRESQMKTMAASLRNQSEFKTVPPTTPSSKSQYKSAVSSRGKSQYAGAPQITSQYAGPVPSAEKSKDSTDLRTASSRSKNGLGGSQQ